MEHSTTDMYTVTQNAVKGDIIMGVGDCNLSV